MFPMILKTTMVPPAIITNPVFAGQVKKFSITVK